MFNEEMTSKMQRFRRLRHVNREDLGTRLSCFACELEKMADISLVLRVRTRQNIAKNMARTARRQLEGQHLLFGEYLRSWTLTVVF